MFAAAQDAQPTQATVPPQQSGVFRVGSGVTAPKLLFKKEPMYSEEARKARLVGRVVLSIVVAEDGTPQNPRVVRGLGLGLDEMAIEAVRTWRFDPGKKEGKPVKVAATVEVNFRLLPDGIVAPAIAWHLTNISFQSPALFSRPTITKVVYPPQSQEQGSFTLSLEVDETGVPKNVRLEKSSDVQNGSAIMAAVQNWRFSPGLQDGKPVVAPCTMSFVLGDVASQAAAIPPQPPRAVDSAKAAAIEELMTLTNSEELIRRTFESQNAFVPQIERALPQEGLTPEIRGKIREESQILQKELVALMIDAVSPQRHKQEYIRLYDEVFTTEEVQGMLAFYKSPIGEAMLKKTPIVMGRSTILAQQLMAGAGPEIQKRINAWAEMMKQKYGITANGK